MMIEAKKIDITTAPRHCGKPMLGTVIMEIYADFRQKVQVNPKDVIEKLIEKEIGWRNWIFEKDGKFYLGSEQSAGCHSFDVEDEITEERYRYVEALQLVLKWLG